MAHLARQVRHSLIFIHYPEFLEKSSFLVAPTMSRRPAGSTINHEFQKFGIMHALRTAAGSEDAEKHVQGISYNKKEVHLGYFIAWLSCVGVN